MHLNLTESCAEAGIYATSEAERAYWLSREKSYLTASVEIDVHAFHDALGLMYPNGRWTGQPAGYSLLPGADAGRS